MSARKQMIWRFMLAWRGSGPFWWNVESLIDGLLRCRQLEMCMTRRYMTTAPCHYSLRRIEMTERRHCAEHSPSNFSNPCNPRSVGALLPPCLLMAEGVLAELILGTPCGRARKDDGCARLGAHPLFVAPALQSFLVVAVRKTIAALVLPQHQQMVAGPFLVYLLAPDPCALRLSHTCKDLILATSLGKHAPTLQIKSRRIYSYCDRHKAGAIWIALHNDRIVITPGPPVPRCCCTGAGSMKRMDLRRALQD
jgi:hypothetical protein